MILVVLFFLFDAVVHILVLPNVVQSFIPLQLPISLSVPMGITLLVSLVLYCMPRTTILGAILITGYLGGAILANARVGASFFSAVTFPVVMGILVWGSSYILEPRLRALIPFRKK
ncbi:MAG TPA: DoxX family protein [Candidatus Paceibacterota bacterium]|nr:DoxX family protein [Candidatus Paceibacterota bacterium]